MLHLRITTGANAGEELKTQMTMISVGRSPECRLTVHDKKASRVHGEIVIAGGRVLYRDHLSRNGTELHTEQSGKVTLGPLMPEWPVAVGDRIVIGKTEILLVAAEADAPQIIEDSEGTQVAAEAESADLSQYKSITLPPSEIARFDRFLSLSQSMDLTNPVATKYTLCEAFLDAFSDAAAVSIIELHGNGDELHRDNIDVSNIVSADRKSRGRPSAFSFHILQEAYRRKSVLFYACSSMLPEADSIRVVDMESCLCGPLYRDGRISGFVHMHTSLEDRTPFRRGDAPLFALLTSVASQTIGHTHIAEQQTMLRTMAVAGKVVTGLAHEVWADLSTLRYYFGALETNVAGLLDDPDWESMKKDLDLLAFLARDTLMTVRSGSQPLETAEHDVRIVVQEVIDRCHRRASQRWPEYQITMINDCSSNIKVTFDRRVLAVALSNAVLNSVDAAAESGRPHTTLKVTSACREESGSNWFSLAVIDDAGGIPPDVIRRLGKQLVSTKGSMGNGLGFGIMLDMSRRMHGSVRISTSTSDTQKFPAGTVVEFRLPIDETTSSRATQHLEDVLQFDSDYEAFRSHALQFSNQDVRGQSDEPE